MEDQYELISKETLQQLREENQRLKNELAQKQQQPQEESQSIDIEGSLKELFSQFEENQKKILSDEFEQVKELNKSTLNNVLSTSQNLNDKFSGIIETMQQLVENLSRVLEEVSKNSNSGTDFESKFEELKKKLDENKNSSQNESQEEIVARLAEIETFMENLKVLLSQIKPSDMSISKQ